MVAATLATRTLLDVFVLTNGTRIERAIITRNKKAFLYYLLRYISMMVSVSLRCTAHCVYYLTFSGANQCC